MERRLAGLDEVVEDGLAVLAARGAHGQHALDEARPGVAACALALSAPHDGASEDALAAFVGGVDAVSYPPALRPLGPRFGGYLRLFHGGSDDGGFDELLESKPSLARSSTTSCRSSATNCSSTAIRAVASASWASHSASSVSRSTSCRRSSATSTSRGGRGPEAGASMLTPAVQRDPTSVSNPMCARDPGMRPRGSPACRTPARQRDAERPP